MSVFNTVILSSFCISGFLILWFYTGFFRRVFNALSRRSYSREQFENFLFLKLDRIGFGERVTLFKLISCPPCMGAWLSLLVSLALHGNILLGFLIFPVSYFYFILFRPFEY